jgi:transposase
VRIVSRVRGTLIEAARAAARTRDTFLAPTTTESAPAAAPTAPHSPSPHSLLVAVWRMLQTGEIYLDPGGDYYARRDPPAPPDGSSPGTSASGYSVTPQEAQGPT